MKRIPLNDWSRRLFCLPVLILILLNPLFGQQSTFLTVPFFENWNSGVFETNRWTHEGSWMVRSDVGYPMPAAVFTWDEPATFYEFSLVTDTLFAPIDGCTNLWLDFSLRVITCNPTSLEKLTIEVWNETAWDYCGEYANIYGGGWIHPVFNINQVRGKPFRVRFKANGFNSVDLFHWELDNIRVYSACAPPLDLVGDGSNSGCAGAFLAWSPPVCPAVALNPASVTPDAPLERNRVIGYNVYRHRPYEGQFFKLNTQVVTDTFFCVEEPVWSYQYFFVQTVYDSMNCSGIPNSDTIYIFVSGTEEQESPSVSFYPNPATTELTIQSDVEIQRLMLSDLSGCVLLNRNDERKKELKIRTGDLSPGLYVVTIITEKGIRREKVLIGR